MSQLAHQPESLPTLAPQQLPTLGSGEMFDRIAARYDFVNRVLSLGLDQRWRRRVVRSLGLETRKRFGRKDVRGQWFGERPRVLDVATGTGDLAIEIARACPGASVIGLDPSGGMLGVAKQKLAKRGLSDRVELVIGDAQHLPQKNCEIDAATIAFGIRNVPDRGQALRELARVVRPGGRIAVLELGEPRRGLLAAAARLHCHHIVPKLGGWLSGSREYEYLQRSVAAFPPAEEFADLMRASGLDVIEVVPLTFGVCTLYLATPAEER
ncbi:MAG TPA: bifunctional demethylmenaquinone methyltransferase/2-methoxy-6-polyprenyl-1,4-benzoquinol methylase UbiE [Kofleriaceae bacterium]|nr:bifunctional demethylmenaquinone methyltransferase/2-methoxy-6-polyprenyl-1,4-benzoquinol methylase UbiE [Kofleriaceae bacterium]